MADQKYDHLNRWNILLDELCNRAGFLDTGSLASRFCELSNKGGQREFEAAVRNLNNWRSGRHIPRLRSLRVLEQLLKVDDDPELSARWHALYRQATEAEEDDDGVGQMDNPSQPAGNVRSRPATAAMVRAVVAGAVLFSLGVGTGVLLMSDWRPWGGPADDAPIVEYEPEVQMVVGESRVIHSERGDCGKLPREWPDVSAALPLSQTGVFSDGGLARRNSKFCGGYTPARAIVFTSVAAGVEEFLIQGDFFKVTVAEADEASTIGD